MVAIVFKMASLCLLANEQEIKIRYRSTTASTSYEYTKSKEGYNLYLFFKALT